MKQKILLISLNPDNVKPFKKALEAHGYVVKITNTFYSSNRKPAIGRFDLAVMFWETNSNGNQKSFNYSQSLDALFMYRDFSIPDKVQIYQNGIYFFDGREADTKKFVLTVRKLLRNNPEKAKLKSEKALPTINNIVGNNPEMVKLRELIKKISQDPGLPLLISGETGTGKELVSDIIHYSSSLAWKPFVKINCSAIPENLLESQLFGYIKGAFTGAFHSQKGLLEQANGGTVLFDEIGELSLQMQPKLLRFLEDHSFHPVGSTEMIKVNVWVLAATNASLKHLMEKGLFRRDLYYRLSVMKLELPPLRERLDDVPLLIKEFLKQEHAEELVFERETIDWLMKYDWPGNVRELKNLVRSLAWKKKSGSVGLNDLPWEIIKKLTGESIGKNSLRLIDAEKKHILEIFEKNGRQLRKTASLLGISRNTLKRKLAQYGVHKYNE